MVKVTNRDTGERKSRVLHVPLTDAEFKALRVRAWEREQTMGQVAAFALTAALNLQGSDKP